MPSYTYRSKGPSCGNCEDGFRVWQRMSDTALSCCPACGIDVYRAITQAPQVKIHDYQEYREDLSRRPNDPEAFVTSKRGLKKLIEKRQRQGWGDPVPLDEFGRMGKSKPVGQLTRQEAEETVRKAFHEAGV